MKKLKHPLAILFTALAFMLIASPTWAGKSKKDAKKASTFIVHNHSRKTVKVVAGTTITTVKPGQWLTSIRIEDPITVQTDGGTPLWQPLKGGAWAPDGSTKSMNVSGFDYKLSLDLKSADYPIIEVNKP